MARVVDAFVSVFGNVAVRSSFRISGFLRPCGLPGLFVLTTEFWPNRFGRPAMRGRVDVDLRDPRLLGRRGNCHGAFTLVPQFARVRDSAIGNASYCAKEERRAEDGGCLNGGLVHSH